uniref:Uncharacterized protein n=2 Tax=Nothobranchius furzeri TaxID=105023 RepID=A0A1A8UX79_NOTFU
MKKPSVLPGSTWKIPKPRVREREVTKRKVKNNKRYLSSSDDEAGPCSTERTRVPMAERMLLLIEPSSRDVPVSKRTTLPAESLNGEVIDLMATSTPRQRVTPKQKATEDQAAGIADVLKNIAAITDICKSLLIKVNMMEGKMHAMEKLLHNVASRHSESQTQDNLRLEHCNDAEDFTLLENNLQDKAYFQQAVRFLSLIGGRKLGENTRTMLAVASNAVWCGYSLYGKKQKAKLCNLKIFRLIKRAVKTSLPDSTDKDIEVQIIEVLKHAPQKVRREAEAQHRATQMEAHSSEED